MLWATQARCLHNFPAAMLVSYWGTPTWWLHTGFCKFVQNISTNIWSFGKLTDLKFGERSYLFISYNIIISWLYTLYKLFFYWVTVQPKNSYGQLGHILWHLVKKYDTNVVGNLHLFLTGAKKILVKLTAIIWCGSKRKLPLNLYFYNDYFSLGIIPLPHIPCFKSSEFSLFPLCNAPLQGRHRYLYLGKFQISLVHRDITDPNDNSTTHYYIARSLWVGAYNSAIFLSLCFHRPLYF